MAKYQIVHEFNTLAELQAFAATVPGGIAGGAGGALPPPSPGMAGPPPGLPPLPGVGAPGGYPGGAPAPMGAPALSPPPMGAPPSVGYPSSPPGLPAPPPMTAPPPPPMAPPGMAPQVPLGFHNGGGAVGPRGDVPGAPPAAGMGGASAPATGGAGDITGVQQALFAALQNRVHTQETAQRILNKYGAAQVSQLDPQWFPHVIHELQQPPQG